MQEVEAIEPDADMTAERKTCLMGELITCALTIISALYAYLAVCLMSTR